jgi:cytidylate kinase
VTPFVIALDGPAASGKSTVGLGVARALRFRYFDSGLLYRVTALLALQAGLGQPSGPALAELIDRWDIDIDAEGHVLAGGADITPRLYEPRVDQYVSYVAAQPEVRARLVPVQRALMTPPGLVLAGRDIGTVIAPDAALKIWLVASVEERARRRAAQTGEPLEAVLNGMRQRDYVDASRAVAPMARATDAVELDTDELLPDDVIARIVELARQRGADGRA